MVAALAVVADAVDEVAPFVSGMPDGKASSADVYFLRLRDALLHRLVLGAVAVPVLPAAEHTRASVLRRIVDCAQRLLVISFADVAEISARVSSGPAKTSKAEVQLVGSLATLFNCHVLDALSRKVRRSVAEGAVHGPRAVALSSRQRVAAGRQCRFFPAGAALLRDLASPFSTFGSLDRINACDRLVRETPTFPCPC